MQSWLPMLLISSWFWNVVVKVLFQKLLWGFVMVESAAMLSCSDSPPVITMQRCHVCVEITGYSVGDGYSYLEVNVLLKTNICWFMSLLWCNTMGKKSLWALWHHVTDPVVITWFGHWVKLASWPSSDPGGLGIDVLRDLDTALEVHPVHSHDAKKAQFQQYEITQIFCMFCSVFRPSGSNPDSEISHFAKVMML